MFSQKKILKVDTDPQYMYDIICTTKNTTEQPKQEIQFRIVSFLIKNEAGPGRPE